MNKRSLLMVLLSLLLLLPAVVVAVPILRENISGAKAGDYIVTAQGKNYTLLHVYDHSNGILTMEEITVPSQRFLASFSSWRCWMDEGAPGYSAWLLYRLNMRTGVVEDFYSFTGSNWASLHPSTNILPTLLSLNFQKIALKDRKKVGAGRGFFDKKFLWHPKMVIDGEVKGGVYFEGWRARWPKDDTELSGKAIEIYLPEESTLYPSYFPYWLQVSGVVGKAQVRIVDSGKNLQTIPKVSLPTSKLN